MKESTTNRSDLDKPEGQPQRDKPPANFELEEADVSMLKEIIPNFSQVTPGFFRGGQPSAKGLKALADAGIKTIICLRWSKSVIEKERQLAEARGMRFENIRLNYWSFPNKAQIDRFFSIVDNPESQPVFLHCLHGSDRTGLITAIFRMGRQFWHVSDAYNEMKSLGFHRFKMHHFKWAVFAYWRKLTGT